jgi:hypothetical protein
VRREKEHHGYRLLERYKSLDELWTVLFQREFRADPLRGTFFSLPWELRDMVYRTLFNQVDITQTGLVLTYDAVSNRFWPDTRDVYHRKPAEFRRTIDALLVLDAMNKEIRREAQIMFWSLAEYTFLQWKGVDSYGPPLHSLRAVAAGNR